eukprot:Colp12_sorted_trinity150504_noHs@5533
MKYIVAIAALLLLAFVHAEDFPRCPVCGMDIEEPGEVLNLKGGQRILFCDMGGQLDKFKANVPKYLVSVTMDDKSVPSNVTVSGSCPVCGMSVPAAGDPRVQLKNGQAIHTCSHSHAQKVFDNILDYVAA